MYICKHVYICVFIHKSIHSTSSNIIKHAHTDDGFATVPRGHHMLSHRIFKTLGDNQGHHREESSNP